jgi:CelD/BcsL family acetyltransferase involved in cellulose biosynthesis
MGTADLDSNFDVALLHGSSLTSEHLQTLSDLQASDARLASPFFSAGFIALVSTLGDNVRVGLAYRGDRVLGAFPFQSSGPGSGEPLAHPASDFHGVLSAPGVQLDPERLLLGCGLRAWDFHHLLAHQEAFQPYHSGTRPSPYLDFSRGFDAYVRERRESGTHQFIQIESSRRKLEAERGEIRFVAHEADDLVLAQLRDWKDRRFREKGIPKEISPWQWSLFQALSRTESESFAGMLSALYAGGELVAVHLGMRSRTRWHYWYPAFNPRSERFRPGLILLREMARHAHDLGLTRIDLSSGDEPYKARIASGHELVARGQVALSSLPHWERGRG